MKQSFLRWFSLGALLLPAFASTVRGEVVIDQANRSATAYAGTEFPPSDGPLPPPVIDNPTLSFAGPGVFNDVVNASATISLPDQRQAAVAQSQVNFTSSISPAEIVASATAFAATSVILEPTLATAYATFSFTVDFTVTESTGYHMAFDQHASAAAAHLQQATPGGLNLFWEDGTFAESGTLTPDAYTLTFFVSAQPGGALDGSSSATFSIAFDPSDPAPASVPDTASTLGCLALGVTLIAGLKRRTDRPAAA